MFWSLFDLYIVIEAKIAKKHSPSLSSLAYHDSFPIVLELKLIQEKELKLVLWWHYCLLIIDLNPQFL